MSGKRERIRDFSSHRDRELSFSNSAEFYFSYHSSDLNI
jgi:hypothetical protein